MTGKQVIVLVRNVWRKVERGKNEGFSIKQKNYIKRLAVIFHSFRFLFSVQKRFGIICFHDH